MAQVGYCDFSVLTFGSLSGWQAADKGWRNCCVADQSRFSRSSISIRVSRQQLFFKGVLLTSGKHVRVPLISLLLRPAPLAHLGLAFKVSIARELTQGLQSWSRANCRWRNYSCILSVSFVGVEPVVLVGSSRGADLWHIDTEVVIETADHVSCFRTEFFVLSRQLAVPPGFILGWNWTNSTFVHWRSSFFPISVCQIGLWRDKGTFVFNSVFQNGSSADHSDRNGCILNGSIGFPVGFKGRVVVKIGILDRLWAMMIASIYFRLLHFIINCKRIRRRQKTSTI